MGNNAQKSLISDNSFAGKAIVSFPADSIILNEGVLCPDMFKIIQGRAEMYIGYGTDKEVLLGIIGPGTCFGEWGLLMKAPAIYTVIAYSDVYAIRVTEDRIDNFIQENHTSILQIMRNMAKTMAFMQHQVMSLSEELSSFTQKHENDFENVEKELLREYYLNNVPFKLKGKMHFLGSKGNEKR